MNIPFLSLKDVTALHGDEINEAVDRGVVHLFGRNAYTDKIGMLCRRYSLKLVDNKF